MSFRITQGKGFQMTFANGWTVSVQFGPGNYCEHYAAPFSAHTGDMHESSSAEIAAWDSKDQWYEHENGDVVLGHATAGQVAEFIALISAKAPA